MSIQLAMVGLVVSDMKRSLEFYRRLGLDIPVDEDEKRFVMHRMPSGVTIFFDTVFFPANDPERRPAPRGSYNISLEFYAGTREAVDRLYADLTGFGYVGPQGAMEVDRAVRRHRRGSGWQPDPHHRRGSRRRDLRLGPLNPASGPRSPRHDPARATPNDGWRSAATTAS